MIHAQSQSQSPSPSQDSCNSNLANLNGQFFFDTSSLNCIPVWSSENFILRYGQAGPSLWSFVLSTPSTNSYVGMGFSSNGGMVGSSAIVGWVGGGSTNMKKYLLGGQTPSQVLADEGDLQIVGNTSSIFSESARIYMAFQLVTNQPRQRLVYAVGDSSSPPPGTPSFRLTRHRSQIALRLDYASGEGSRIKAPYSNLKRAHGILNMIGWGILLPVGVMVARYFKHLDPLWFYVHTSVQSLGFILGLSGVIAGLVLDGRLDASVGKHKGLGITILVLGCLQVLAFMARPSIDAKTRKYWNWYHYIVGRLIITFAIVNIFYGIHLAKAGSSWNAGYGVVLGIFVITVLVLEIRMLRKK
ncbi:Carbohydrate-binding domain family 9-like protein [Cynara cardunculus var. scolymus]|uniref:Carbohydrate-binding domain family 9-like protein n=2 Tax=Cynara cardunculus var. scolymus TaxID=59895 RepID=A0A103XNQ9_CYNCS|nr:Carbohydrate-binding domain family 9-like protein [Cynara cardunculus var. scolymus]